MNRETALALVAGLGLLLLTALGSAMAMFVASAVGLVTALVLLRRRGRSQGPLLAGLLGAVVALGAILAIKR